MNQNFAKLAAAAVITTSLFATSAFAAEEAKEEGFKLTGNVQAQAIKAVYDNDADNTLDNSFLRANIGGKYTSGDFEAVINLRIFSPAFGNKVKDGDGKNFSFDKISADTYYAKYKWNTGFGDFSAQFGRFRTDWTVAGNFGTYVDVHPSSIPVTSAPKKP